MEVITREQFEAAKDMKPILKKEAQVEELTEEQFNILLDKMQHPVKFQKELAVKVKIALDHQIEIEMTKKGVLSDHTRRWVESYNKILDKIQSAIHGDKSVNLHLHKVSHSDISSKIRESVIDVIPTEKKEKRKSES